MNFENYSFLRDRWTKAAASYECEECGQLIRKGDRHCVFVGKPHGWKHSRLVQVRMCQPCGRSAVPQALQLSFSLASQLPLL